MKLATLTLAATLLSATAVSANSIGMVDTNGDRFASLAELRAVYPGLNAADFRDLDVNDDRRVSANEINAPGAEAIIARHKARSFSDLGDVDRNGDRYASMSELAATYPGFNAADFHDIDLNNDNRVSAREFYGPAAQTIVSKYEQGFQILVSLDALDTDGSGFADLAELSAQYPGLTVSEFHRVDRNGDNRISFDELYTNRAITTFGKNQ